MTTEQKQPPISQLLKDLRDETTDLVKQEVQLAKTEIAEKASKITRNAIYLMAGAFVANTALLFLLLAVAAILTQVFWNMDMALATAAFFGFLIVAIIVGIIAAILISKSVSAFNDLKVTPERTIDNLKTDKAFVERKMKHERANSPSH